MPIRGSQFTGWSGDVPEGHESDVPLELIVTEETQNIVANFQPGDGHPTDLVFDSDFENGNGMLRYNIRGSRNLIIEPLQVRASNNVWWYFKIRGITPGEFLRFDVNHCLIAGDSNPVYRVYCADGTFAVEKFAEIRSEELEATGTGVRWLHELRIHKPKDIGTIKSFEPTLGLLTGGRYCAEELMDMEHPEGHIILLIETPHWRDGYGNDITINALYAYVQALGQCLNRYLH